MDPIGRVPQPCSRLSIIESTDDELLGLDSAIARKLLRPRLERELDPLESTRIALLQSLIMDELAPHPLTFSQPVDFVFTLGRGRECVGFVNLLEVNTKDMHSCMGVLVSLNKSGRLALKTMGRGVRPKNRDGFSLWIADSQTGLPNYQRACRFITSYLNQCVNTGLDRRSR